MSNAKRRHRRRWRELRRWKRIFARRHARRYVEHVSAMDALNRV